MMRCDSVTLQRDSRGIRRSGNRSVSQTNLLFPMKHELKTLALPTLSVSVVGAVCHARPFFLELRFHVQVGPALFEYAQYKFPLNSKSRRLSSYLHNANLPKSKEFCLVFVFRIRWEVPVWSQLYIPSCRWLTPGSGVLFLCLTPTGLVSLCGELYWRKRIGSLSGRQSVLADLWGELIHS